MIFKNSLKFYITRMFFLIIATLSVLLISLNYQNAKELNTKIAKERMSQNAQKIKLNYHDLTSSIHLLLSMLTNSELHKGPYLLLKNNVYQSIGRVLAENSVIDALYVGYDNNDFTKFSAIKSVSHINQLQAPANASFYAELNSKQDEISNRYFFDDRFVFISSLEIEEEINLTKRPWYLNAKSNKKIYLIPPYQYESSNKYGVTYSKRINNGVIAIDITLKSLHKFIDGLDLFDFYDHAELIILDHKKNIIVQKGVGNNILDLNNKNPIQNQVNKIKYQEENWWIRSETMSNLPERFNRPIKAIPLQQKSCPAGQKDCQVQEDEEALTLIIAIPEKELLDDAFDAINRQIFYTITLLIMSVFWVFIISEKIVSPLKRFTHLAGVFSNLNFKGIKIPQSKIAEINELSKSFTLVADTIDHFLITLTLATSTENLYSLLQNIVDQCKDTAKADFALLWTENENKEITLAAHSPQNIQAFNVNYHSLIQDLPKLETNMKKNQPFLFSPQEHEFLHCQLPKDLSRAWVIPMINRQNNNVGCIMLGFNKPLSEQEEGKVHFLHAFLGFISLIHENWTHIYEQKQLFLSLIEMVASAIDTKSPYTGGHCQRVPELSFMLAEAAHLDKKYHPDFRLNEQSREALHLAAWLHDCGKMTTPEYVIDKATKLETIYNRIHEIRMRFEVIKRDKQIHYWQQLTNKTSNKEELDLWLSKEINILNDEFAFIAKMNLGETQVNKDDLSRLAGIATRSWQRTLDDTLGLSWEEKERVKNRPFVSLPVTEPLLKDAQELKIHWLQAQQNQFKDWDFKLQPSKLQFNRGELYNLSVLQGTLTDEERFIINNHIVQTIKMLCKLPYPDHLARIPEIAGGHHERLDGKGYPRGLMGESFSIDARIIAIADIFEALTARDRPYKGIKTVSESLTILAKMAKDQHIDSGLFRIFIEQKIYFQYAKRFLLDEQCDEVDENAILALLD